MRAAPAAVPSGRLSDVDTGQTSNLAACGRWSRYPRLINWGPHTQRARRYEYLRRIHNTRALLSRSTSALRHAASCRCVIFAPQRAVCRLQDARRRAVPPRVAARGRAPPQYIRCVRPFDLSKSQFTLCSRMYSLLYNRLHNRLDGTF